MAFRAKAARSRVLAPIGVMLPYGGDTAPEGWAICDGAAVSRTTFAALFAVLGTAYGAGDGATTFNLPDMRLRFPLGSGAGFLRGQVGGALDHFHSSPTHVHAAPTHVHSADPTDLLVMAGAVTGADGAAFNTALNVAADTALNPAANTGASNPPYTSSPYIIKTT